jgi:hypothetical protein
MVSPYIFQKMDVRVLIFSLSGNRFQASVVDPTGDRVWRKVYASKPECVTDLRQIGLYTITESEDAFKNEAVGRDRLIVIEASTEAYTLKDAGFAEFTLPSQTENRVWPPPSGNRQ